MIIPVSEWKLFCICNKFDASLAGRITSKDEFSTLHNVTIASYWTTHLPPMDGYWKDSSLVEKPCLRSMGC